MRAFALFAALLSFFITSICFAQNQSNSNPTATPEDRLSRLERRLDEAEAQHRKEMLQKDAEIAELRRQLPAAVNTSKKESTSDSLLKEIDNTSLSSTSRTSTKEIEQTKSEIGTDLAKQRQFGSLMPRTPANFNPDLAVVGEYQASYSTDHRNPARNRMDIGAIELDLRAAIDPRADGVVVLPIARDTPNPLFFDGKTPEVANVENTIEIEEAYFYLHDFGVKNLTAKLGRFHLRFGRNNILHGHDWQTVDNNFVNQSFLGSESIAGSGISLSYVIPPKWIANNYVELIAEIVTGDGGAESPVFNSTTFVHTPSVNLHALWNHDFGNYNVEIGSSFLYGKHNSDNHQNASLYGIDATVMRTDPKGGFNNQLFMFESIYGNVDTGRFVSERSFGAYLLAQQQLNRDWYAGMRLDWTQNALDHKQEVWGVSPYVSWYWSEFLRFRLEYQHKAGDVKLEDTLYFQVVFIYGAHPPHPYWAAR